MDFAIPLNGSNYVSEKTKQAFEEALEDGHRLSLSAPEREGGNGKPRESTAPQPAPAPQPQMPAPQSTVDASAVFEVLEHGLARSFDHQQLTLRVHEQYLNNQSDYAAIFSQLMAQQGEIFANGNTSAEQAEAARKVLESLAQSMERFHALQVQSLEVHQQFLSQQSQYSQAYVQLLQNQRGELSAPGVGQVPGNGRHTDRDNGNGNDRGNGHSRPSVATPRSVSRPEPTPVVPAPASTPSVEAPVSAAPAAPAMPPEPAAPESTTTINLDVDALAQSLLEIVGEKTGYPAEMLELDMDMEADLGIDSIKRVEILGALQDAYPELPEVEGEALAELRTLAQIVDYMGERVGEASQTPTATPPPPPAPEPEVASESIRSGSGSSVLDLDALTDGLLEIVGEKTGYPAEMLELDMDMEADLGIDSIKRVEILGALQDAYPELPEVEGEALAELRTLDQIVDYMGARTEEAPVAEVEAPKKA